MIALSTNKPYVSEFRNAAQKKCNGYSILLFSLLTLWHALENLQTRIFSQGIK